MFNLPEINLIGKNIPWLKKLRDEGLEFFKFPNPKEENWRYTNLKDLEKENFFINQKSKIKNQKLNIESYKIKFNNGIFSHSDSDLPMNIDIIPLIEKLIEDSCHCEPKAKQSSLKINQNINIQKHPFAALNTAYLQEGLFIKISGKPDKPIAIINHSDSGFCNLRNIIILEENSSAEIIEIYEGNGNYFTNQVNEIKVNKNAKLEHYKLQAEALTANHIALTVTELYENAEYNYFCHQKGGKIARNELNIKLKEPNATAVVNGTYLINNDTVIDNTVLMEHLSPEAVSDQLFKGVINDNTRGVFQGKISIAKNAQKAQGNMLHKAILLTDTAEVDCKPELEIFADDVKCSHGAATGELDENQLFYMQSRGIDLTTAKQLLIDAYLDEVIEKISNIEIRDWIKTQHCHPELVSGSPER